MIHLSVSICTAHTSKDYGQRRKKIQKKEKTKKKERERVRERTKQ